MCYPCFPTKKVSKVTFILFCQENSHGYRPNFPHQRLWFSPAADPMPPIIATPCLLGSLTRVVSLLLLGKFGPTVHWLAPLARNSVVSCSLNLLKPPPTIIVGWSSSFNRVTHPTLLLLLFIDGPKLHSSVSVKKG